MFLPRGMAVTREHWYAAHPVFLLIYNVGGALSVIPVSDQRQGCEHLSAISFYMAVMGIFFALITAKAPMKVAPVVQQRFHRRRCRVCQLFAASWDISILREPGRSGRRKAVHRAFTRTATCLRSYLILPAVLIITASAAGYTALQADCRLVRTVLILAGSNLPCLFARRLGRACCLHCSGLGRRDFCHLHNQQALRSRIVLYFDWWRSIGVICLIMFALSFEEVQNAVLRSRAQIIQPYDVGETGRFGRQLNGIPAY